MEDSCILALSERAGRGWGCSVRDRVEVGLGSACFSKVRSSLAMAAASAISKGMSRGSGTTSAGHCPLSFYRRRQKKHREWWLDCTRELKMCCQEYLSKLAYKCQSFINWCNGNHPKSAKPLSPHVTLLLKEQLPFSKSTILKKSEKHLCQLKEEVLLRSFTKTKYLPPWLVQRLKKILNLSKDHSPRASKFRNY